MYGCIFTQYDSHGIFLVIAHVDPSVAPLPPRYPECMYIITPLES